jgi:hypothetical protein
VFAFDFNTSASNWRYFETFIDFWFLSELILNFITGYYYKGVLVVERKKIAYNYVKTWFVVDLISSFPYSVFYFTDPSGSTASIVRA